MDHLFHPWHWIPVLIALPFLGVFANQVRDYVRGKLGVAEDEDRD